MGMRVKSSIRMRMPVPIPVPLFVAGLVTTAVTM